MQFIPAGDSGPLWSVMIPTFNSGSLLESTLNSVLMQDPGPDIMQIEVVDDHSTRDDPEPLVRRLGGGRIGFFRQPVNVGHARNFETCRRRARGRLLHVLHSDDRLRAGFYETMEAGFASRPEIGAAFCRQAYTDMDGKEVGLSPRLRDGPGVLDDALGTLVSRPAVQASAMVVRCDILEELGGFDSRFRVCGEDWELWIRIANRYPVWFVPHVLAEYRSNPLSLTAGSLRSGAYFADLRLALATAARHFPAERASALERDARTYFARVALFAARQSWDGDAPRTALAQVGEALRFRPSPRAIPQLAASMLAAARWLARAGRGAVT
jgi:GT2 family glycosyltransferase